MSITNQDLMTCCKSIKAADPLTINEENRLRRKVQELELDIDEIHKFKKELDDLKDLVSKNK
jgi:hypothetical protein